MRGRATPPSDTTCAALQPGDDLAGAPAPPGAYAALADAGELLAAAKLDQELAAELLALPARVRAEAARDEPRYRRPSLVKLLALRAEGELFDPAADARPVAALGAVLAGALARDPHRPARPAAALAHWLLGKAFLKAAQWRPADDSFREMAGRRLPEIALDLAASWRELDDRLPRALGGRR